MRRDRHPARLILAALVATALSVASILVPLRLDAIMPTTGDAAVGWVLLLSGVVAATMAPGRATLLLCAGTLWVLVGLAPLLPPALEDPLARAALLPTALVAVCTLSLPRPPRRTRQAWLTWRLPAAAAVGAAVVGGLGAYQFSVLAIGAFALAPAWPRDARARAVRVAYGAGTVVVGLGSAGALDVSPDLLATLHDLALVAGAAGTAWVLTPAPGATAGIELDEPHGLDRAVADLLAATYADVALPAPGGGWLDAAGRPLSAPEGADVLTGADGEVVALVAADGGLEPDRAVHRLLAAAGRGAVLRAELRERVEEIAASRERLTTAADHERRRLTTLIDTGPVATLDRVAADLERAGEPRLARLVADARSNLLGVVSGLDPVADGLVHGLERLVGGTGAHLVLDADAARLSPTQARAVWFTAAEGLTNATRHAPGAVVRLALQAYDDRARLTVTDDGPGGADAAGSGLAGLRARAASAGGRLTVTSSTAGTELALDLPLAPEGKPQPGLGLTPIPGASPRPKVEA